MGTARPHQGQLCGG